MDERVSLAFGVAIHEGFYCTSFIESCPMMCDSERMSFTLRSTDIPKQTRPSGAKMTFSTFNSTPMWNTWPAEEPLSTLSNVALAK